MTNKPNTARITFSDGTPELDVPVKRASIGADVIDIGALYGKTGKFTLDPGFMSTAGCESAITYVDGEKGELLYRGYPIEQLCERCDFLDVAYLLLNGELASPQEAHTFKDLVMHHTMVHEQVRTFFSGFRRDAHPMAVMAGVVGALSAFYHDSLDILDPRHREVSAIRLIAKMPTLVAMAYKYSVGQPFVYPRNDLNYTGNFLHMMYSVPCETYRVDDVVMRALDRIFIIHADHEQNASTSTVRLAGSSGANPFACIAAGIASLWGPSHGGANEAALNMLLEIGDESRVGQYIARAKDKSDSFRLMGFGHRVYKSYDPRAKLMQETCHELLHHLGLQNDPTYRLAMALEKIAREDDYFVSRRLYPNIEFYSGIVQRAMGIPTNLFTAIFALARTVGWIAHWTEMIAAPDMKLGRPRQLYTGRTRRNVPNPV